VSIRSRCSTATVCDVPKSIPSVAPPTSMRRTLPVLICGTGRTDGPKWLPDRTSAAPLADRVARPAPVVRDGPRAGGVNAGDVDHGPHRPALRGAAATQIRSRAQRIHVSRTSAARAQPVERPGPRRSCQTDDGKTASLPATLIAVHTALTALHSAAQSPHRSAANSREPHLRSAGPASGAAGPRRSCQTDCTGRRRR
jgi:hypothetical protein